MGNLKSIGGDAIFEFSQVIDLGKLKSIGGDAYFSDSQVMDLGKLKFVGGEIYCNYQVMKQLLEKRGLI